MEIKNHPSLGGDDNKKQLELLKNKINGFLIDYFNYLVFSLGVIIFAAGLFLSVYPKYQQIAKVNEESKNNLQAEYETKLNYLNSIRNLQESYQSISAEEKTKLDGMLPAGRDTSAIIKEIESIAVRNGVILTSIKIEPESGGDRTNLIVGPSDGKEPPLGVFNQPPPEVGLIKININLGSINYPVLKNIIKAFENNLRLFDIAMVTFNAGDNQAVLSMYSYYLK